MSYVTWDSSLDVKVPTMNEEHKQWIKLINTLYDADESGQPQQTVISAYNKMHDYIKVHFSHEEKYLEDMGYPLLEEHKQAHREFMDKIEEHRRTLMSAGKLSDDYFHFLSGWLIRHIKIVDTQYGEFVIRKAG